MLFSIIWNLSDYKSDTLIFLFCSLNFPSPILNVLSKLDPFTLHTSDINVSWARDDRPGLIENQIPSTLLANQKTSTLKPRLLVKEKYSEKTGLSASVGLVSVVGILGVFLVEKLCEVPNIKLCVVVVGVHIQVQTLDPKQKKI